MTAEQHEHILPLKIYFGIAATLFILTGVTVGVSYIDLGSWNIVVAIGVASIKAALVALFFMHLLYDNKLYLAILLAAILFVGVFIIITMFDTIRRADIYEIRGESIQKDAIIYDNETTQPADNTENH
jgi:cytochrome c oxidase subunit IV